MYTSKVQNQILGEHLLSNIKLSNIRAHRVAILIGRPVLWRLSCDTGTIPHKGVIDININRCTMTLSLPVTWHSHFIPSRCIVIITIEINWAFLWVTTPMEQPLTIETDNLLMRLLLRWQLQSGVIRQFVDAQYGGVLPIGLLCLDFGSQ